jgi:ATP-dependent Clp protease ATP-binding subunit ClpC
MFERYTEKARRVIFFARYEASNYGGPYIESEHVLLALLREDDALANRLGDHVLSSQKFAQKSRHELVARALCRSDH